jgi:periplasmic divalent cation tolerance protein
MPFRLILTTVGSQPEARKIARALVDKKLAACINIIPKIESIYRWQGKVKSAQEWLLVIKTTKARARAVEKAIKELHSYELPECIVIPIEGGSREYLAWLGEQVRGFSRG